MQKTDEEKQAYLLEVEKKRPGFSWEMAEGKAQQDITSDGKALPQPILANVHLHQRNGEDKPALEEG